MVRHGMSDGGRTGSATPHPMVAAGNGPGNIVNAVVDHLFRHEAGRIVATLTRVFGLARIDLAEDVVQGALLKALQQWSFRGIPENPPAWIMQVAKNMALDLLRRQATLRTKEEDIASIYEPDPTIVDGLFLESEIRDDQLRMMFACCHPRLPEESRIALTLKTLCGFSVQEIAHAFLLAEETVAKRLVRARQTLREESAKFEIPSGEGLRHRVGAVQRALYLLFNEGYSASSGNEVVRRDLVEEAIRLATLLSCHPSGDAPATHALLALMLLHGSRLSARTDDGGNILLLQDQDRSLWDHRMLQAGLKELDRSAAGSTISSYHLEAGIAACHCLAPDYESTDWSRILTLYDMLLKLDDSPLVGLNRAVAVAKVHGPEAALATIEQIPNIGRLDGYYLSHAVIAEQHLTLRHFGEAACHYRKALALTRLPAERMFISQKLKQCEQAL